MSTAVQLPITTEPAPSKYQIAARSLPGFSRNSIVGDGPYCIKILCPLNRKLLLFETSNARRRKLDTLDRGACSSTCKGDHFIVDLVEYMK